MPGLKNFPSPALDPAVSQYAVDFCILAAECGWDERALQGIFVKGLSEELKDELAARDETSSLDELISLATRLDNRLRERRRERAARLRPPYSPSPSWSARPPALSPPPPGPPTSSGSPSAPSSRPSTEEPMQLGRTRLSQVERLRRRRLGLCIYCGQAGHLLAQCPVLPKEQAQQPWEGHW